MQRARLQYRTTYTNKALGSFDSVGPWVRVELIAHSLKGLTLDDETMTAVVTGIEFENA